MKGQNEITNSKQDLKTPIPTAEEKQHLSAKIQAYVEANTKKVIYISSAVIVITVLFFVIKGIVEKNNEEKRQMASLKISRILPYFEQGDFNKALYGDPSKKIRGENVIGLIEIVKQYSGTKQAATAAIYAGQAFLSINKPEEASAYFKKALDAQSNILVEGGYAGLAVCSELKGDYKEAADNYEKAASASVSPASRGKYNYFQGLCFEKSGDKEKAGKLFHAVIDENKSDYVGVAKSGLVRLGTIIE